MSGMRAVADDMAEELASDDGSASGDEGFPGLNAVDFVLEDELDELDALYDFEGEDVIEIADLEGLFDDDEEDEDEEDEEDEDEYGEEEEDE